MRQSRPNDDLLLTTPDLPGITVTRGREMHELALTQSIVDLATECARREGLRTVTRVVVEVGAASAVDPQALGFCFDIVAAQSMAACPECGAYGPRLLRGRELRVKSLEGE